MAIDGTYKVTGEAKGISLNGVIDVQTEGNVLTGTAHVMGQDLPIKDGKVDGDKFSCTIEAPTPMGNLKLKVSGAVDGDRVEGMVKHLLIKAPFTGERA